MWSHASFQFLHMPSTDTCKDAEMQSSIHACEEICNNWSALCVMMEESNARRYPAPLEDNSEHTSISNLCACNWCAERKIPVVSINTDIRERSDDIATCFIFTHSGFPESDAIQICKLPIKKVPDIRTAIIPPLSPESRTDLLRSSVFDDLEFSDVHRSSARNLLQREPEKQSWRFSKYTGHLLQVMHDTGDECAGMLTTASPTSTSKIVMCPSS
mmetsp:Transcript_23453/g.49059  ORF Transcript_23453/g.49059 Transcript_23453/m.49059 type:complete len:215 (+) Transcript_23453:1633-2277(+)